MTYTLYNRAGSGGYAVEAALELLGADWRLVAIDSRPGTPMPESFRATNPMNQVPVLDLPDGSRMTESGAMLIHLADAFPGVAAPRPGTPAHAQFLRWIVFMSANLYETQLHRSYPQRFTDDPDGADAVKASAEARLDQHFDLLESRISPGGFLLGDRPGLADIYLAMFWYWRDRLRGRLPKCTAIIEAVRAACPDAWQRNYPGA